MLTIERFEMERMQSTWENVVEMDMSESGVRPLTLRELVSMGFDLEGFMDVPLGYSQSNGTIELREALTQIYPGAKADNIEVTNGTSEANYLVALALLKPATPSPCRFQITCSIGECQEAWVRPSLRSVCGSRTIGSRIGKRWNAPLRKRRGCSMFRIQITRPVRYSRGSDGSIVRLCERTGTYLLADEVYQGAENTAAGPKVFGV